MDADMHQLISAAIGAATLAVSTYLGITRDTKGVRTNRMHYAFAMLFILFAIWVGGNFVVVILAMNLRAAEGNVQQSQIIMQLVVSVLIGVPGLTALMRTSSGRCRDAGYGSRVAYLGATPLLQILFWIWLLFPRSAARPQTAAA